MAENDPNFSTEQKQLLQHEAFMARVLKERETGDSKDRLSAWQHFFESAGGAALITAIIVGIIGAIISLTFQSSAKEREFQQAWLKARGDQAMVAFKDFVDRREDFVKSLFDQIGNCQTSAQDYITLTRDNLATATWPEEEQRTRVSNLRESIKSNFETNRGKWRAERGKFTLSVSHYYPTKPSDPAAAQHSVPEAWKALSAALTEYMDCSEEWVDTQLRNNDISKACVPQSAALTVAIDKLSAALDYNRTYVWEGWESPEKLRRALDVP